MLLDSADNPDQVDCQSAYCFIVYPKNAANPGKRRVQHGGQAREPRDRRPIERLST